MCKGCYFCRLSLGTGVSYECSLDPSKRFNNPYLNGLLCINKKTEDQVNADRLEKQQKRKD